MFISCSSERETESSTHPEQSPKQKTQTIVNNKDLNLSEDRKIVSENIGDESIKSGNLTEESTVDPVALEVNENITEVLHFNDNETIIHLEDMEEQAFVLIKKGGAKLDITNHEVRDLMEDLQYYMEISVLPPTPQDVQGFFSSRGYELAMINDNNPNYLNPDYGATTKIVIGLIAGVVGVVAIILVVKKILLVVSVPLFIMGIPTLVGILGFAGADEENYMRMGVNIRISSLKSL